MDPTEKWKLLCAYLLALIARKATQPAMAQLTGRVRAHASVELDSDEVASTVHQGRARRL